MVNLLEESDQIAARKLGRVQVQLVPDIEDFALMFIRRSSSPSTTAATRGCKEHVNVAAFDRNPDADVLTISPATFKVLLNPLRPSIEGFLHLSNLNIYH